MLYPDSLTQLLTDSSQPVVSLFINLDTGGQALSANKIKLNSYAKQIRDQLLANHPNQTRLLKQVEACLSIAPQELAHVQSIAFYITENKCYHLILHDPINTEYFTIDAHPDLRPLSSELALSLNGTILNLNKTSFSLKTIQQNVIRDYPIPADAPTTIEEGIGTDRKGEVVQGFSSPTHSYVVKDNEQLIDQTNYFRVIDRYLTELLPQKAPIYVVTLPGNLNLFKELATNVNYQLDQTIQTSPESLTDDELLTTLLKDGRQRLRQEALALAEWATNTYHSDPELGNPDIILSRINNRQLTALIVPTALTPSSTISADQIPVLNSLLVAAVKTGLALYPVPVENLPTGLIALGF